MWQRARPTSAGTDCEFALQGGGEHLGGAGRVAGLEAAVALRDQLFGLGGALRPGDAIDEGLDLALRHRADEAVDRLAVGEGDDRGNRLDAELAGDRRMIVDVHLDQAHGAVGGAHRLFDDRAEGAARPAPRRPEVDQHRLAAAIPR